MAKPPRQKRVFGFVLNSVHASTARREKHLIRQQAPANLLLHGRLPGECLIYKFEKKMARNLNFENCRKIFLIAGFAILLCYSTAFAQMRDIRPHHTYSNTQYLEKDINERYQFFVSDFVNLVESHSPSPMIALLTLSTTDEDKRSFLSEYSEISLSLVSCANNLLPKMTEQAQSGSIPDTFSGFELAMSLSGSKPYLYTFLDFLSDACSIDDLSSLWARTKFLYNPITIDYYELEADPCTERFFVDDWYFYRSVIGQNDGKIEFEDTIGITAENFRVHFNLTGHAMGYDGGTARIWVLGPVDNHLEAMSAATRFQHAA